MPARGQGYGGADDRGGVRTDVRHRYYAVQGRSEADLLEAMRRSGPEWEGRRFFGLTASEVRYAYGRAARATGCALADLVVTMTITVTLPQRQPEQGVPPELERDWHLFEHALRLHENGHRRLLEEEAEQIRLALAGTRAPSCDAIDAEARQAVEQVRRSYATRHTDYDARTEHGGTQGARWPLRP